MPRAAAAKTRSTMRVTPLIRLRTHSRFTGGGIALDRAGHASRPAAAAPELAARNPQHLDARFLEPCVGLDVAFVGDADPRRDGEGVVAVVPLFPFGGDRIEAGVD